MRIKLSIFVVVLIGSAQPLLAEKAPEENSNTSTIVKEGVVDLRVDDLTTIVDI